MEYIEWVSKGVISILAGGVIIYFLRAFSVKYFESIERSIDEGKKASAGYKDDLCKKMQYMQTEQKSINKELFESRNSHGERISKLEQRIEDHIENHERVK